MYATKLFTFFKTNFWNFETYGPLLLGKISLSPLLGSYLFKSYENEYPSISFNCSFPMNKTKSNMTINLRISSLYLQICFAFVVACSIAVQAESPVVPQDAAVAPVPVQEGVPQGPLREKKQACKF